MARLLCQTCTFSRGYKNSQRLSKYKCCEYSNLSKSNVTHDRQNQRFTITLDCDEAVSSAVLKYTFRHEKLVEFMSTEVPESHRRKGVAEQLAKAALDFAVEENLKVRISCWYIRKYVENNPHHGYQAHIEDE